MSALTDEDTKQIGEAVELVRQGDKEGFIGRIINLTLRLASDIPIVGKLGEEGARALLALTPTGRMKKALAEVTAETSQAEAAQQVARFVVELLQEKLYDLHSDQRSIAEALVRLDAQLQTVLGELSGVDRVHQLRVEAGIGNIMEAGERRPVEITQELITGAGTIGNVFKAKPR